MRAIESEKSEEVRICYDPWARKLSGELAYLLIKLFSRYGERRTHGALTFIVCRQRYIDECLRRCLDASTTQVVILGAGLDSRAYRSDLAPTKVFEVDHPASQTTKMRQLQSLFGRLPKSVTYVPIDFDNERLDKLSTFDFDKTARTLFIWEGVTYYLTAEAVDATLAWILTNSGPHSAVVFDYQHTAQPTRSFLGSFLSRLSGESRAFVIPKHSIEAFLTARGFSSVVDAGPEELKRLYCVGRNQGRSISDVYSIAYAETGPAAA